MKAYESRDNTIGAGFTLLGEHYDVHRLGLCYSLFNFFFFLSRFHPPLIYGRRGDADVGEGISLCSVIYLFFIFFLFDSPFFIKCSFECSCVESSGFHFFFFFQDFCQFFVFCFFKKKFLNNNFNFNFFLLFFYGKNNFIKIKQFFLFHFFFFFFLIKKLLGQKN